MEATKEKQAFTPGPWQIEDCTPGEGTGLRFEVGTKDSVIARTTDGWKEAHANARLIAAAPEMYEKLCELCNVIIALEEKGVNLPYHYFKDDMSMSDKLREVLAKVEGGEG
jgi:hypothetical protein